MRSIQRAGPTDRLALHGFWHQHASILITKPLQIIGIILIALIVRAVVHRAINRLIRSSAEGTVPRVLSPLTDRARESAFWESSGLVSQRRKQRAETIGSVLRSAVSFLLFVTAFLLALQVFDVNLAPFIAGTSLIGVAVGFGAQNVVKDFLSGMFMMLEDQYGVGDVIDVKEATGTVEAVGLRTTRLRDVEGTVWHVRNGTISRVGNQSQQYAQVVLDIPIAASEDPATALAVIGGAAQRLYAEDGWAPSFLAEPEVLGIQSLGRDELVLRLVARVRPLEQWRVARELRARIQAGLAARPSEASSDGPGRTGPDSGEDESEDD
ncbi:MAG: mechanosensitive ion channel family protein [Actinomycetota bacterium]|nr:mechanosensitive ion channel family protein [Actinomycetota bacterium]MDQ2955647.1 mechanosensitive ion channel family protein [Actinomycetota bacterium]